MWTYVRTRINQIEKDSKQWGFGGFCFTEKLNRAYALGVSDERRRLNKEYPELDLYAKGQGD